jgi:hypothetical protein
VSLPVPETGLVIRYSYLWRSEADEGLEEGQKDRPCAVVLAHHKQDSGEILVVVAPITHSEPVTDPNALEIPKVVKQRLGLDDKRSWLVTHDLNSFIWPGPDLRSIDPKSPQAGFAYGFFPNAFMREVLRRIRLQMREGGIHPVQRTE